jgi:hypothetical protein
VTTSERAAGTQPLLRWLPGAVTFVVVVLLFAGGRVEFSLFAKRFALPLVFSLATALSAILTGWAARKAAGSITGSVEEITISVPSDFILGYPIFGTLIFLIALLSTSRAAMGAALAIPTGLALLLLRPRRGERAPGAFGWQEAAAGGLLGVAAALGFLVAQMPPISLDELAYHFAVPKMWVLEGRALPLPLISHSWFPFGIESADLPSLAILGNDGALASHLLHLFAAVAATLLLFRWLRQHAAGPLSWAGTAAIVTTPAILVIAGWSLSDWPLTGIAIVLFGVVEKFVEEEGKGAADVAVCLAAGLLTKYTFVPLAAAILGAALFSRIDRRLLLRACAAGAVGGSVFFLRNLIAAHNPVAPFFEVLAPAVSGYRWDGSIAATLRGYVFSPLIVDEALGIALPVGAVAALVFMKWRPRFRAAAVMLLSILLLGLAVTTPSSRILVPVLLLLTMLALAEIGESRVAVAALFAAAVLHLCVGMLYIQKLDPGSLLDGTSSDGAYVLAHRGSASAARWIDAHLPPHSRTLVLGMQELFWLDHRARGGGNFDGRRVDAYLSGGVDALARRLASDQITHIALVVPGIHRSTGSESRKVRERETILSDDALRSLKALLDSRGKLVASGPGIGLYEIRGGTI